MKNLLILLFLFIFTAIGATTYYIDPSGNDSNNGSSSSPWKTLAYACSKATASGDIIHVNAGTYTETAQSYLAVGVSIEGMGSSSIIKSHYTASNLDNGLIQLSGGTNTGQHISGVYLDGDNNTGNNAIVVSGRNNVTIYNCTLINFSMQGIKFTGNSACTGNSIHDCTITGCSGYDTQSEANVFLQYQTGFLFYNNINNNTTKSTNGDGIRIWSYVYGLQIYNNTLTGPESMIGGYPFVLEAWCESKQLGYGMQIYGNTIIGTMDFSSCVKGTYSYGLDFHNNICGNSSTGSIPTNPASSSKILLEFEETMNDIIIRNNIFRNADRMIYFDSNGTTGSANNVAIYTNIFQNVYFNYQSQTTSAGYSAHGVGILFGGSAYSGAVTNIKICNNDFIAYTTTPGAAELGVFLPTSNTCSYVYVQNNIFKGFATAPFSAEAVGGGGTLSNLYLQKNVLYGNGNSNNYLTAGLTPTNVTNDVGIISDPLFISSTDFHLQTGSPAIGTGVSISGLTTDYEGSTIKNPPSIGAFESASSAQSPVAPVYQSSVVQNATPSILEMTYNITMNSTIIPAVSSFSVLVNTVARTVNSVAISGNKVQLTLASAIKFGDVISVAYTKPATNQIQSSAGGQAISIIGQTAINSLINPAKDVAPVTVNMTTSPNHIHSILNVLLAYSSSLSTQISAITPEIIRITDLSGNLFIEKLIVTGITSIKIPLNLNSGFYTIQVTGNGLLMASQKIRVN